LGFILASINAEMDSECKEVYAMDLNRSAQGYSPEKRVFVIAQLS